MIDHPAVQVRRPRLTSERECEVLGCAVEVLQGVGYEALTMDAVASRAHCSKATLYRQWHDKARLVAAALHATLHAETREINTGTLRGDLHAVACKGTCTIRRDTELITGLVHASLTDNALLVALRETLIAPQHAQLTLLVDRAVERGELKARPAAVDYIPQLMFGALAFRPLHENAHADDTFLIRFMDDVVLPALLHS